MKTIICGMDFSTEAIDAARVAAAWARQARAALRLIHVAELSAEIPPDLHESLAATLRVEMDARASALRAEYGAEVAAVVVSGRGYSRIVAEAVEHDAQLIIVGGVGKGGARGWSLGSTAERVAQHSPVPVLVVRDAPPLLDWLRGGCLAATVCVDMTHASRGALEWSRQLRNFGACELELTYVSWPPGEQLDARPAFTAGGDARKDPTEAVLEHDLRMWAAGSSDDDESESRSVLVNWGRTDAALAQHAVASHRALVVVGTHRRPLVARLWQGSVTRGLLQHTDFNVACIAQTAARNGDAFVVRRVLAALDLSDMDWDVLRCALGSAQAGGEVHVLHVIDDHATQQAEDEARRRVSERVGPFQRDRHADILVEVRRGSTPHAAIVDYAQRMAADVTCVGAKRRSRAADLLLGSQSRGVLASSRTPVMLVPVSVG